MSIIIPEEPGLPSPDEIGFMRDTTKIFIDCDPIALVLTHQTRTALPDGGFELVPHDAPSQVFRLIPQSDVAPLVQTPDGVQLQAGYVLLGEWDSDMRRWDMFTFKGVKYQIVSPIRPEFREDEYTYERKGDVARR